MSARRRRGARPRTGTSARRASSAAKVEPFAPGGGSIAWPDITDPTGTKPTDGADKTSDNVSKDTNAVGGRPVAGVLEAIDRLPPIETAQTLLRMASIDQAAILRQADRDRAKLAAAQISGLLDLQIQRVTLRDAGMVTDPETGRIYLYGVDQNAQRVSKVEIGLDAVSGQIALRATYDDVHALITQAQLDPASAAEFGEVIRRLNSAEVSLSGLTATIALKADAITVTQLGGMVQSVAQTLDALAGVVSTKVSYSDFTPLRDRVGAAEQALSAIGDVSSYTVTVRQAELRDNAAAAAGLTALISSSEGAQRQVARAAEVQQQLYARLVDGDAAEAAARLLLSVRVGSAEGRIATEESVRATETSALTRSTSALSATLDNTIATISADRQASVDRDAAQTRARELLRADLNGAVAQAGSDRQASVDRDSANARDISQVASNLAGQSAIVSQLFQTLVTPTSTTAKALVVLDVNGRISGTRQTNNGALASFDVLADSFGVYLPDGKRIFYVDVDGAIAANFKKDSIGYDNMQMGAVQKAAFFTLGQDVSIARGATTQVVALTFTKEDADSILEIIFNGDFSSPDDLQFTGSIAIDGMVVKTTRTNIILVDANAAMPITPFAYATGVASGQRTVTFTVTNNENDNAALTIAAGSTIKVVELRKGSIGSASGSGAVTVTPGGGGSTGGGGSGGGGSYGGGPKTPNIP